MVNLKLLEALRKLDEITLIEVLGVNSTDIVDAFLEIIEDNENSLYGKVCEEQEEL